MQSRSHLSILPKVNFTQPPYATRYPELAAMMARPAELEFPTGNRIETNAFMACGKSLDLSMKPASRAYVKLGDNLQEPPGAGLIDPVTLALHADAIAAIQKKLPGFEPISTADIGLYLDEYRRTLPTSEATGRTQLRPPRRTFDSNVDMERSNR